MMTLREKRLTAAVLLAAALLLRGLTAYHEFRALRTALAGRPFAAHFVPGLVEAVAAIRSTGAARAFGPHHDRWPYAYHRLTEMLYPVRYHAPVEPGALRPGDPVVLLPDDALPVPSRLLFERYPLQVVEVLP